MTDSERLAALESTAAGHTVRLGLINSRMTDVEGGNVKADDTLVNHEQRLKAVEDVEAHPAASAVKRVVTGMKKHPVITHVVGYTGVALLCLTLGHAWPAPNPGPVPPGPIPTPTPTPTPTPVPPTPTPAPIPGPGFSVLVVYDASTLSKMPAAQVTVLYSQAVRAYIRAKGSARFLDKDADTTKDAQAWQAAMQRPRQSLPWIVVSNGTAGFEGPLPATEADTLALLKKYGG